MFVYIYTHPLMTTENKSSISSFIPKLRIKWSMSSLPNSHLPKQQKAQAILTAYFHLLNGKYSMVFIIFFYHGAYNFWTDWTHWFPCIYEQLSFQNEGLVQICLYIPKITQIAFKALFLQADWGLPRRMNGILISTNYISLTKTHMRPEKNALCWLLFCPKLMVSCQKPDCKGLQATLPAALICTAILPHQCASSAWLLKT